MVASAMINQLILVAKKHNVSLTDMQVIVNNEAVSMIPAYDEKSKTFVFYTQPFAEKNDIPRVK